MPATRLARDGGRACWSASHSVLNSLKFIVPDPSESSMDIMARHVSRLNGRSERTKPDRVMQSCSSSAVMEGRPCEAAWKWLHSGSAGGG